MIYNGNSGTAGISMPSSVRGSAGVSSSASSFTVRATTAAYVNGIFALMCIRLLILYLRIIFLSIPIFRPCRVEEMTFNDWSTITVPRGFIARWTSLDVAWIEFTRDVLVPLFSAVCTSPESSVYDHPVEEFLGPSNNSLDVARVLILLLLDYIWLTLGHHHYVALNGVQEVVSKLIARVQHVHLSAPLTNIRMNPNDPTTVLLEISTSSGPRIQTGFHHIIVATQANRAVPLLESFVSSLPPHAKSKRRTVRDQISCLRQIPYCLTVVVNHTDPSLLPDDIQDKRELNIVYLDRTLPSSALPQVNLSNSEASPLRCLPLSHTMATHVLTPPEGYPAHLPAVYQTTNPTLQPRESRILSVANLERAVLTIQSKRAVKGLSVQYGRKWWQAASQGKTRLGPLQGARPCNEIDQTPGIWLCGSYAYSGIPLLEGCVVSARNIVEQGIWKSEGIHPHISW